MAVVHSNRYMYGNTLCTIDFGMFLLFFNSLLYSKEALSPSLYLSILLVNFLYCIQWRHIPAAWPDDGPMKIQLHTILHKMKYRPQKVVKKMSRKGPKVGQGMLDFVEDYCLGVKLH